VLASLSLGGFAAAGEMQTGDVGHSTPVSAAQPPEIAQAPQRQGSYALVQIVPEGRIILVYVAPDGTITPAQVVNVEGDVAAVDDIADSSVVWVRIDDDGAIQPFQVASDGTLVPARANADGRPLLPEGTPPGLQVFAAQVSADGRLLPILRTTQAGFPPVQVTTDGRIIQFRPPVAKAPEAPKVVSGLATIENSGTGTTGIYNGTLSLTHADLWGLGHIGSASVTTSVTDPAASQSVFGSYTVPVSGLVEGLDDALSIYGFYYAIKYDTKLPTQPAPSHFKLNGYTISPSYHQNIYSSTSQSGAQNIHAVIYGFTFDKSWTRDYGFGQDDSSSIVRMPFSITYQFTHASNEIGLLTVSAGYTRNIPLGAANDGPHYRKDRANADPRYDKFSFNATHSHDWQSGWSVNSTIAAQYANEPMITAEAFSLGGITSIRGLEDAKTIGETGVSGQFEVTTPNLIPLTGHAMPDFSGRLFGFVDGGWVDRISPPVGDPGSETAVALGGGIRLTGPYDTFVNFAAGWLIGGSAVERYRNDDGRLQIYASAGVNF
jgi:hypothetical protein